MRKIGLIAMALVLALGTLGVGYAMWTDTVTINGSVTTGNVDLDIDSVSCTYVYKVVDDIVDDDVTIHEKGDLIRSTSCTPMDLEQDDPADAVNDLELIASAVTTAMAGDDSDYAWMTFTNIFPTTLPIEADIVLHYDGTIPAHIVYTEDDSELGALSAVQMEAWYYKKNIGTPENPDYGAWVEQQSIDGLQLHQSDLLKYVKYFDLPESDEGGDVYQGLSGNFLITIEAQQWNE